MLRITLIGLIVFTILFAPCSYGDLPRGTEIRAFMNEVCIVSDEPYLLQLTENDQLERSLGIGSIVVSKLAQAMASRLVRATSSQLGPFKKSNDMYYVAARDFNLYHAALYDSPNYGLNEKLACATVVAAEFEPENVDCTHLYEPKVLPASDIDPDDFASRAVREDGSVENVLRRANICLRGPAHSVYEVRVDLSDDQTAYRLQSAGLWVNSLLGTDRDNATRGMIYTVEIAEPAAQEMRVLSSAWVDVGEVNAGHVMDEPPASSRSDWLRIPPMSPAVERAYQVDTSIHQDVYAEIKALERSIVRDGRQLEGMRNRLASADGSLTDSIEFEIEVLELRILRNETLLDARRAEYLDLPQLERNYMPVSIRFGVIESRNQKRAKSTLAAHQETNRARITAAPTMVERSSDMDDVAEAGLKQARVDYYDALVAYRESTYEDTPATADMERNLMDARDSFNTERAAVGIDPIQ